MNEVIVGVKKVSGSALSADDYSDAVGAVQTHFVIIDGVEMPGVVRSTSCDTDDGFMTVTVTFVASEYRTVDYREKEKFLTNESAG